MKNNVYECKKEILKIIDEKLNMCGCNLAAHGKVVYYFNNTNDSISLYSSLIEDSDMNKGWWSYSIICINFNKTTILSIGMAAAMSIKEREIVNEVCEYVKKVAGNVEIYTTSGK